MARLSLVHVFLSVTSLDPELARVMEPRTSIPSARLRAVKTLAAANIPVGVMAAPIIPGLNDSEMPGILTAAKDAGAISAGYILLRLPLTVEPVFLEWLERTQPDKRAKVEGRIRNIRGGKLSTAKWGERMQGRGQIADQIKNLFQICARKYGLNKKLPPLDTSQFQRPDPDVKQLKLF
jgi:DNA repair photolyase